jgi:hypothetical protein
MHMSSALLLSVDLGWRRTRTRSVGHRRGRLGAPFPGQVRAGPASAASGTAIASGASTSTSPERSVSSQRRSPWLLLAVSLVWVGCASNTPAPPPPAPTTPAPAEAAVAAPAEAAEEAPSAETPVAVPAPECTAASDCTGKGKPAKGMNWACTDGNCMAVKATGKKKKKGR